MSMVLERDAENTQANWQQYERGQPKSMQSILRFPSSPVSSRQPKRKPVAKIMPVYLGKYDTEPETERKFGILLRREPVSAIFFGLLKEDGEECVDHDKPPK